MTLHDLSRETDHRRRSRTVAPAVSAALLAAALALGACAGEGGAGRAETVEPITSTAVPARFAAWSTESSALVDRVGVACTNVDGAVTADQQLVDDALAQADVLRSGWAELEPFWFGPAADRRSKYLVDWPITPDQVEALVAGSDPIDATAVRDVVGADQRGLEALDHLFGVPVDARRCEYALAVTEVIEEEADALAAAWTTYGPTLAVDDAAANDALTDLVSESLFIMSSVGDSEGGELQAHRVAGVRWAILGDGTVAGLAPLLDDDVVEQLTAELDAAALSPTGEVAMDVQRTIETNVVSELGIPVKFSDADGDGGA